MSTATPPSGPRIYNLFPLLAGPLPQWAAHLERARRLGFDWVFINPFAASGHSGSLYSIKDHYAIDPRFLDPNAGTPDAQLARMIDTARGLGLKLMADLVINHTAFDASLALEHPDWYKRGSDGKPRHPTAKDGDEVVTWGDLFEIDNADSPDRDSLWRYWLHLAEHYVSLGFDGFRCDAAYKVPNELWGFLIERVKQSHPQTSFFAESLGCPITKTVQLAQSGFDYIFNSSKWWNFADPWCLEQYRQSAPFAPSVSFPESHDTERLAAEMAGNREAVKLRYAFSALFSTGVMMPMGFEYGFRHRLDVVKTTPQDWEQPQWDLSEFVTAVHRVKASRRVFNEEGPVETLNTGNAYICALLKSSRDGAEKAVLLLNTDRQRAQSCETAGVAHVFSNTVHTDDLSPGERLQYTADLQTCHLKPSGIHILCGQVR